MKVHRHTVADEAVTVYFPTARDEGVDFLAWLAARDGGVTAFDTETTGLNVFARGWKCRLVQFGTRSEAWVLRVDLFADVIAKALEVHPRFVAHNATYDALAADVAGLADASVTLAKTMDTAILSHLHDPRARQEGGTGHKLKHLAATYIDANAPDTEGGLKEVFRKEYGASKSEGWAVIDIDHPVYVLYAGLDVILTARLLGVLGPVVQRRGFSKLVTFEHAVEAACARMERRGMLLDVPYTEGLAREFDEARVKAERTAAQWGVENVNSTAQVAEALKGLGWEPLEFTPTGAPKVDKSVLGGLAKTGNPLARAVTDAKRAGKWRKTYADAMLEGRDAGDRVHPSIRALQARTARMSVAKPPLQQLPSSDWTVRRCLVADEGQTIGGVDYAAVEMRVLAALADEKTMKAAIERGEDLHSFTATLIFGEGFTKHHRDLSKMVGFGKVYGGGAATLARQSGQPVDVVKSTLGRYDKVYPGLRRYSKRLENAARFGPSRSVTTPSGRVLPLDGSRLYAATNYAVQSTARDVLAQALLDMEQEGLGPYLLIPVHDEVVFQAPTAEAAEVSRAIAKTMAWDDFYGVRLDADDDVYGASWGHGYACSVKDGRCQTEGDHPRKFGVSHGAPEMMMEAA